MVLMLPSPPKHLCKKPKFLKKKEVFTNYEKVVNKIIIMTFSVEFIIPQFTTYSIHLFYMACNTFGGLVS